MLRAIRCKSKNPNFPGLYTKIQNGDELVCVLTTTSKQPIINCDVKINGIYNKVKWEYEWNDLDPKFYRGSGLLTPYSFACGYVEKKVKNDNQKTLYREHNVYHVQAMVNETRLWRTYELNELSIARKYYKSIKL